MISLRPLILMSSLLLSVNGCIPTDSQKIESQGHLSSGAKRAEGLAIDKFAAFIAPERKYGNLGLFLSDVKNYDVAVDERSESYTITFRPRGYRGRSLNGGGGLYVLSKKDLSILREEHSK